MKASEIILGDSYFIHAYDTKFVGKVVENKGRGKWIVNRPFNLARVNDGSEIAVSDAWLVSSRNIICTEAEYLIREEAYRREVERVLAKP